MQLPWWRSSRLCAFLSSMLAAYSVTALALDCPADRSSEALTVFRLQLAQNSSTSPDSAIEVEPMLERCFPEAIPGCFTRTRAYARARLTADSETFDSPASVDPHKQPPEEFIASRLPNGMITLHSDIERIAAEKQWPAIRYKSRHAGGFDSETPSLLMVRIPGDRTQPPVPFDRYLNFAIPADEAAEALNPSPQKPLTVSPDEIDRSPVNPPSQFTIVTLKRATGRDAAEVTFQKYSRSHTQWRPDPQASVSSCYGCHPNGLRAISPLGFHVRKLPDGQTERQLSPEEWWKVREMNHAMDEGARGRMISWRGAIVDGRFRDYLVPAGIGPSIGPTTPFTEVESPDGKVPLTRQREFIVGGSLNGVDYPGCFQARPMIDVRDIFNRPPGAANVFRLTPTPAIRWQVVRDAMNCASCHNNISRGALNEATAYSQIQFKLLVDQSMPHGHHADPLDRGDANAPVADRLNPNERIALTNCLEAEFMQHEREQRVAWLTEGACESPREAESIHLAPSTVCRPFTDGRSDPRSQITEVHLSSAQLKTRLQSALIAATSTAPNELDAKFTDRSGDAYHFLVDAHPSKQTAKLVEFRVYRTPSGSQMSRVQTTLVCRCE